MLRPPAIARPARWLSRNAQRTVARFRNVPAASIPSLYWRALRLQYADPARLPPPPRTERVVISLSTIPRRVGYLRAVLNSLIDQTVTADRIVLALPHYSSRERRPYPETGELDLPPGVDVLRCADYGPATKLLPVLAAEPRAIVVVVDDDAIYPRNFVATLIEAHRQHPGDAVGYRGVRLAPPRRFADLDHVFATSVSEPTSVDILFGTWGYLLPPGVLDGAVADFAAAPAPLRWVDDIWVSGHLARRGIRRLVTPADALPIETRNSMRSSLAGGLNKSGSNDEVGLDAFASDW